MNKIKSKTEGLVKIIIEDIFNGSTVFIGTRGENHVYKGLMNLNVKVRDRVKEGDIIGEVISNSKYEVVESMESYKNVLKYCQ